MPLLLRPGRADVEIVTDRYTFEGQPAISGWGVIPAPCCVAQASATASGMLLLMTSGEMLLAQGEATPRRFVKVALTGAAATFGANASLIVGEGGLPVGVAAPTGVLALTCAAAGGGLTCAAGARAAASLGAVHGSAAVPAAPNATAAAGTTVAFIASANGLFRAELGASAPPTVSHVITPQMACGSSPHDQGQPLPPGLPSTAMTAVTATHNLIVCGNSVKVWLLDPAGTIQSWSWVTLPEYGAGGIFPNNFLHFQ